MDKNISYSNSSRTQELVIHIQDDTDSEVYIYGCDIGDDNEFGVIFNKAELAKFVKDLQQVLSEMQ